MGTEELRPLFVGSLALVGRYGDNTITDTPEARVIDGILQVPVGKRRQTIITVETHWVFNNEGRITQERITTSSANLGEHTSRGASFTRVPGQENQQVNQQDITFFRRNFYAARSVVEPAHRRNR